MIDVFEVLDSGLLYCSVCTNITDKKRIEELTNVEVLSPSGNSWKLCSDVVFNGEETIKKALSLDEFKINPSMLCSLILYTHKHYTLQCFDSKHSYFKSPDPKELYKYTPRVVVQATPVEVKETIKHTPLERSELNGVSFLDVTKRGDLNLKIDSLVSSKDEVRERRRALRKIGKQVKVIGKNDVYAVYVVL
jgi:hypothetical protein